MSAGRTLIVGMAVSVGCADAPTRETPGVAHAGAELVMAIQSVALLPGNTAVVTVHLVGGAGLTAPVRLEARDLPAGITVRFDRGTLSARDSMDFVWVTAAADAPAAEHRIRLGATGGAASTSEPLVVAVRARPLQVEIATPSRAAAQRMSVVVPVSVSRVAGFDETVTLRLSAVPGELAVQWGSQTLRPGEQTSTVTLTSSRDTPPGTYPIVVIAQAEGGTTATATLSLQVTRSNVSEIALAVGSTAQIVNVDSTSRASVVVTRYGSFTGPVSLSIDGFPAGLAVMLDPPVVAGAMGSFTLRPSATLQTGEYVGTLRASGAGAPPATTTVRVRVLEPPRFTLAASDSMVVAHTLPGFVAATTTRLGGYRYPIDLSFGGLPPGITTRLTSAGPTESRFAIEAGPDVPPGEYRAILRASGPGGVSDSAYTRVRVDRLPEYTLTAVPSPLLVARGTMVPVAVHASRYSAATNSAFTGAVQVTVDAMPAGIIVGSPDDWGEGVAHFHVTVFENVAPGDHRVVFRGRREGLADVLTTLIVRVR